LKIAVKYKIRINLKTTRINYIILENRKNNVLVSLKYKNENRKNNIIKKYIY